MARNTRETDQGQRSERWWFKVNCNILDDYEFLCLEDRHQSRYIRFEALHTQGKLVGASLAKLSFLMRLPVKEVESSLSALQEAGYLKPDRTPHDWDTLQSKTTSADRMRKSRAAKKAQAEQDVTCDVTSDTTCDGQKKKKRKIKERGGQGSHPPSNKGSKKATQAQEAMLCAMAEERGTQLAEVLRSLELMSPIRAADVTEVKRHLDGLPHLSSSEAEQVARKAQIDEEWHRIEPIIRDGHRLAAKLESIPDEGTCHALFVRLDEWLENHIEGGRSKLDVMRSAIGMKWDDIPILSPKNLPAIWQEAGITPATCAPRHGAPASDNTSSNLLGTVCAHDTRALEHPN